MFRPAAVGVLVEGGRGSLAGHQMVQDATMNFNHTAPVEIATVLNQFFTTVDELPASHCLPEVFFNNPVSFSFSSSPASQAEIIDAASQLLPKKSEDFNVLSMFFI